MNLLLGFTFNEDGLESSANYLRKTSGNGQQTLLWVIGGVGGRDPASISTAHRLTDDVPAAGSRSPLLLSKASVAVGTAFLELRVRGHTAEHPLLCLPFLCGFYPFSSPWLFVLYLSPLKCESSANFLFVTLPLLVLGTSPG